MKEKAKHCLLNRNIPKRVSRIIQNHPTIGADIEKFVSDKQMGADAWRRTGVITFDGNRRPKGHIQKKNTRSSSGEVSMSDFIRVNCPCVVKNKRRISAKRYKGIAKITSRRARKGFTLKYNPDAHWSNAFYRNLDSIQLKNGRRHTVAMSHVDQPTHTTRTDVVMLIQAFYKHHLTCSWRQTRHHQPALPL